VNQTLAQEPQPAGEVDKTDESSPVEFEVVPSSISINAQASYDESGTLTHNSGNLAVSVRLKNSSALAVHEISNLKIIHAITDTQEKLVRNPQYGRNDQPLWTLWNHGVFETRHSRSRDLHMTLNFTPPRKQIRSLVEVSGSFDVVMPVGEPLEALLSPFSDFEGKRLTFKEFPDAFVLFQSRPGREIGWGTENKVLRVELSRSLLPHLARVSIQDHLGESALSNSGSSYGTQNDVAYRMYQMEMPANGQVRLLLYPKIRIQTIHFTLRDVPLVKDSSASTHEEVAVELKPVNASTAPRYESITPVAQ
jgi:hypothetical protein